MNMQRTARIVIATMVFAAVPCTAQQVFTIGVGTNSCGKWTEAAQSQVSRATYKSWVLGFLSGSNWQSGSAQGTVPDPEAAVAFLDEYCKHNPLHIIALGAAALVQESGGPKALHQWKR